jgi:hypothetical protein
MLMSTTVAPWSAHQRAASARSWGSAAVELHADGLVEVVGAGEVEGLFAAREEAVRAEQVGAGEARRPRVLGR